MELVRPPGLLFGLRGSARLKRTKHHWLPKELKINYMYVKLYSRFWTSWCPSIVRKTTSAPRVMNFPAIAVYSRWKLGVVMTPTLPSLLVTEVSLTTYNIISDDKVRIMRLLGFHCFGIYNSAENKSKLPLAKVWHWTGAKSSAEPRMTQSTDIYDIYIYSMSYSQCNALVKALLTRWGRMMNIFCVK